jgi:hypothetical protein
VHIYCTNLSIFSAERRNSLIFWVKFFLNAVFQTALKGQQTFLDILALRNQTDGKIVSLGRKAENARNLIMHLYQKPILSGCRKKRWNNVTFF